MLVVHPVNTKGSHAQVPQKCIQVRFEEAAEPMLDDDQIAWVRGVNSVRISVFQVSSMRIRLSCPFGRCDRLTDTQPGMQNAVGPYGRPRSRGCW